MKNLILLAFVFLLSNLAFSQSLKKKDVPDNLKKELKIKYPTSKKIKWAKLEEDLWEVEYVFENQDYSMIFKESGDWVEVEIDLELSEVPEQVQNALKNDFTDYEVEEAERKETRAGIFYEFELKKGAEEIEVLFDTLGNQIKNDSDDPENSLNN